MKIKRVNCYYLFILLFNIAVIQLDIISIEMQFWQIVTI
jgi:hypothetical protein